MKRTLPRPLLPLVCLDYRASGIRDYRFCLHAPAGSHVPKGGHAYVSVNTADNPDSVQVKAPSFRILPRDEHHKPALERLARKWMSRSIPQQF